MTQPTLFPVLRHHCDQCAAEVEALIALYRAAQARGEFDAAGYTPNERRAQQKRQARG